MTIKTELQLRRQIYSIAKLAIITATNLGVLVDKSRGVSHVPEADFEKSLNRMGNEIDAMMKTIDELEE